MLKRSLFAVLLGWSLLALPAAAQKDWQSTEWVVRCTPETTSQLSASDCDDGETTGPAAATRAALEEASPWLKGLGFYGPDVKTAREGTRKYEAWISDTKVGDESYGHYDGEALYLNSTYYFAMGTGEADLARDVSNTGSAVHELFHAIQHSYDSDLYWSEDHDWIWEGTADAVMLMRLKDDGAQMIPSTRYFDYPLHEPYREVVDGEETCDDCYATNRFWLWLGSELGSQGNVQYLHDFFQEDLRAAKGLEALDDFVTEITLGGQVVRYGLYDVFPAFIAESVEHPDFFSAEGFEELRLPFRDRRETGERSGRVQPVAANAYALSVPVPEGTTAGLKIEFRENHEDLHLIVDGSRYDEDPLDPTAERNVFRTALTGQAEPHELFMRVVNVAERAADSEKRDYTLEFTLEPVDPCDPEVMDLAVNYEHQLMPLQRGVFGETEEMGFKAGQGTLRISGLVNDGGTACSNPLSASVLDRIATSDEPAEPFDEEQAEKTAQALQDWANQMAQQIFGKPMDEVTDEDIENMTPEQQRMMAEMMGMEPGKRPERPSWREKEGDVVIPVYSPHATTWKGGALMHALNTRHSGVAGWQPNAAALINLHLKGTEAADLEEGATYEAHALSSPDPIPLPEREVQGTGLSFYTQWDGQFVDDCGEMPEMFNTMMEGLVREMDPEGEFLQTEDMIPGCAVGGTSRMLWGQLSGTVTIEEITGAEVKGRFRVSGPGRLLVADGEGEREETGSVAIEGRFSAPTERVPFQSNR